jgi:hypothetical protein
VIVSRIFLAGLVAIALLFVGSVAFLSWPVRSPGPPAAATARVEADSPLAGPVLGEAAGAAAPDAAPESPRPVSRNPQDLMPPPRRHALISFRRQIIAGLAELQARVAQCTPPGQSRPAAGLSQTSFMLSVESVEGGVRIVDAQPESPGTASEAEVACARKALRGHVIPASSAEPGRRWQLRFSPRAAM